MTSPRVAPNIPNPTHHISLLNTATGEELGLIAANAVGNVHHLGMGASPLQRTAMKTTQGNQSWGDMQYPWTPVVQESFSGGRGAERIERDMSKFSKSLGITSAYGFACLGGMEKYSSGYRNADYNLPGSVIWTSLVDDFYFARKIPIVAGYALKYVSLYIRKVGAPTADLTIELCSESAEDPDSVLATQTVEAGDFTDTLSILHRVSLEYTLVSSTSYWLKVYSEGDLDNHWEVATEEDEGNIVAKTSIDDSTWSNCDIDLYYLLNDAEVSNQRTRFFNYKYMKYMLKGVWGAAPKLYVCGDRGVADANTGALGTLIDATKTWTVDQWKGWVVRIINGTGIDELDLYRTVVSNTATTLTLDSDFTIEHDTTTEYVLIGGHEWTEVTGHGITKWVTSTLVINGIMYFAQGDDTAIRRGKWDTAGYAWGDDGTNKATFLTLVRDDSNGYEIWKANNLDGSTPRIKSVAKSALKAWGTDLAFGTVIALPDLTGRINSILEFGTTPTLFVFTEGSIWYLYNSKFVEISLMELRTMPSSRNGIASVVNDVYLYSGYGYGIERYLDASLDDIGFNRDEGLPYEDQGFPSCMISYPGRLFVSVDSGANGYSGVYMYSTVGWSELYRCPTAGLRISSISFEAIEGEALDRLWISAGNNVWSIPFPSYYVDPTKDRNFEFRHEGYLETAYIHAGMFDIYKLFNTLTIHTDFMNERQYIEVDYKLDTSEIWTPLPEVFDQYPSAESPVGDEGISGKRIKLRFRFYTQDINLSPKVIAYVLEVISHIPVRYGFTCDFRVRDNDLLLDQITTEEMSERDKISLLLDWAESLTPLVLHSTDPEFHNWKVFIDPTPLRKYLTGATGHICTLKATQRRKNERYSI